MTELIAARRRVAVFLALFTAAVVLLTTQVRSADRRAAGPVGTAVLTLLLPAQAAMARLADVGARWWRLYVEIGRLREDNRRLRREVDALTRELVALREQAAAAPRLERLLGLRALPEFRPLAARVIGRDLRRWFSTIVIDRGGRDGVRKNLSVVVPEGLIGRVIEVTPTAARVLLISDSRSALGVLVQRSREMAVVEGRGGPELQLKYLSRAGEVAPGDIVVTSGLGGVFPRGLTVGRVTRIIREPGALAQEAAVEPAAPLDRIEEVLVLLPPP